MLQPRSPRLPVGQTSEREADNKAETDIKARCWHAELVFNFLAVRSPAYLQAETLIPYFSVLETK